MTQITAPKRLERVEHILASGTGTLDFAIEGDSHYLTWEGAEDAKWTVDDVATVENTDEDRFILYPKGEFFTCEITSSGDGETQQTVYCHSPYTGGQDSA